MRITSVYSFFLVFAGYSLAVDLTMAVPPKSGVVVSAEEHASQVGISILRRGGNAVDAAVGVGFALAVTYPSAGNLGGGGFMLIQMDNGKATVIDYRETAPFAAQPDAYLNSDGLVIPALSQIGYRASGVPGTPAGLCLAHARYGRLSFKEVIQPAINLAENGFQVGKSLSRSLQQAANLLGQFPESKRIYLRDGKLFQPDDVFVQKDLAWSLRVIRDQGAEGFYRGSIARKIAAAYHPHGQWINQQDLAAYQSKARTPLQGRYRDYNVIAVPPPSSGGIALLEALNLLEGFDLKAMGQNSPSSIHLVVECLRRVFRDRAEHLGDSDFGEIPTDILTSKPYAVQLRQGINLQKTSGSLPLPSESFPDSERPNTTHFCVIDKEGNAVSNTYTLNGSFGSGVTVEGTGILMNNEMDDFRTKSGAPNSYGLIQGKANSIAPLKRPLSSMTPTILRRNGKIFLVIGSPGGPTIISTVLQVILNVVDFGCLLQEAIDAPRFHHQWLPDEIRMEEGRFSPETIRTLQARGHRIRQDGLMGDAQGILIDPATEVYLGASDSRGDGRAISY